MLKTIKFGGGYGDVTIIVYLHWNFDYEMLPFPSHRKFAKDLIDSGADYVIGGHSHMINGGEIYKEKLIVYGMGNFYIPSNKFFNGRLKYKGEAKKRIILEVDDETKEVNYWYLDDEKIVKENFNNGEIINKYSPYRGMSEEEYVKYFKKQRTKRFLIPIYKDYKDSYKNKLKNIWVINRMRLCRKIKNIK